MVTESPPVKVWMGLGMWAEVTCECELSPLTAWMGRDRMGLGPAHLHCHVAA